MTWVFKYPTGIGVIVLTTGINHLHLGGLPYNNKEEEEIVTAFTLTYLSTNTVCILRLLFV